MHDGVDDSLTADCSRGIGLKQVSETNKQDYGTHSSVQKYKMSDTVQKVRKLLDEALVIRKQAEDISDMLVEEYNRDEPESERQKRRPYLREMRIYMEGLHDKCWAILAQCYQLLQAD